MDAVPEGGHIPHGSVRWARRNQVEHIKIGNAPAADALGITDRHRRRGVWISGVLIASDPVEASKWLRKMRAYRRYQRMMARVEA